MRPRAALALTLLAAACDAPARPPYLASVTTLLDPDVILSRFEWWDNRDRDWYRANIPLFESPDDTLDATYYYRWEVLTKHLTYGSPETGYVFTEFLDRPFWSGTYGAISCPLGHQFYEARWLRNRRYAQDYARYWFETPGAEPRRYSNWYGDAMWATYMVSGDSAFLRAVLPHMETQVQGWVDERWDPEHGMFRWVGAWDGMETNINSRQTDDEFGGAEGYRPTLNSYLWADMMAISRAAALFGDEAKAASYRERADALRDRVQEELWDPEREFFFHQFAFDEKDGIRAKTLTHETGLHAGSEHGRELIGYVPWQFGLPGPGYENAWRFLMDPDYFAAPFGPTTVERNDPLFYVSPRCCVWSGNAWPYATSQTLTALANVLNDYEQDVVDRDDYVELLRTYSRSQRMDGRPYVAEAANPDDGSWEGHNTPYHSEHYLHSSFTDLVITGLAGLRPRADDTLEVNPLVPEEWDWFALDNVRYHGHDVALAWDRDGTRYGRGRGLLAFVDGEVVGRRDDVGRLTVSIPPGPPLEPVARLHNFAANNDGRFFPHAWASFSAPEGPSFYAIDGNYWYHDQPANRWTTTGTDQDLDWIEVDFGVARPLEMVKLFLLEDGRAVLPPVSYHLRAWMDGHWVDVAGQKRTPAEPTGRRANVITFPEVETSRLRVSFVHLLGAATALTEIEAWGRADLPLPPPTAPVLNLALEGRVSASSTHSGDRVEHLNDRRISFTRYGRNRWTAYGSPDPSDWVMVEWDEPRWVARVDLYLWGDGGGVDAPASFEIQAWDGSGWVPAAVLFRVPEEPRTWARNQTNLEPVRTSRVRIVFRHALPASTGVTEVEIWGPLGPEPSTNAGDAVSTGRG
ncbi:MAG TPA: glycosyl hydrolase family 65 protein [Longimicrobiales bacterium]|jgi:hypothetical protein